MNSRKNDNFFKQNSRNAKIHLFLKLLASSELSQTEYAISFYQNVRNKCICAFWLFYLFW